MGEPSSVALKSFRIAVILVCVVFAAGALLRSVQDARSYSGGDLRYKIVGARLLTSGRNPYSAEYQNQDERFAMSLWRARGPSQVTYDPALLLMYSPFCWTRYDHLRYAWFVVEWVCLLASILLIAGTIPRGNARTVFWCIALVGFVASTFWRLHAERGQYYVYLLLLLSLSWYIRHRLPGDWILFAIPLALATSFRPTFGVIGLVLLAFRQWRAGASYFAFLAIFIGCTLPFGGIARWQQFFANANDIARGMGDPAFLDAKFGKELCGFYRAEGARFDRAAVIPSTNSSFNSYAVRLLTRLHVVANTPEMQSSDRPAKIAIACIAAGFAGLFAWISRRKIAADKILFACITVALVCDMFAPIRFSYVDVIFLLPVGIICCWQEITFGSVTAIFLACMALLLGSGAYAYLSVRQYMMLRPVLLLAACLVKMLCDLKSVQSPEPLEPTAAG